MAAGMNTARDRLCFCLRCRRVTVCEKRERHAQHDRFHMCTSSCRLREQTTCRTAVGLGACELEKPESVYVATPASAAFPSRPSDACSCSAFFRPEGVNAQSASKTFWMPRTTAA